MSRPLGSEPAFPVTLDQGANTYSGADLRDYFATHALLGIIAHPHGYAGLWASAAKEAYDAADAMLAERARRPHPTLPMEESGR